MSARNDTKELFADQPPRDGTTILHCGHFGPNMPPCPAHWFKYNAIVRFERPDKTRGEAEWLAICEPCFIEHGHKVPIRGDGQWSGDAPVIEKTEN